MIFFSGLCDKKKEFKTVICTFDLDHSLLHESNIFIKYKYGKDVQC